MLFFILRQPLHFEPDILYGRNLECFNTHIGAKTLLSTLRNPSPIIHLMTSHSTVDDANGRRCNHEQGEKGRVTLSGRGLIVVRIAAVSMHAGMVERRVFAGRVLSRGRVHSHA